MRQTNLIPSLIGCLLCFLLMACQTGTEDNTTSNKPSNSTTPKNVVFILIDDLGYADIGAYNPNTFYETPNIDALANKGVKFTNGYAANPVCSPSRAAIMLGKHPTRIHATDWFHPSTLPHRTERFQSAQMTEFVPQEEVTLAEVFKQNGYNTAFLGKWHLGEDEKYWPEHQGFDENIGGHDNGRPPAGYFSPYENPRLKDGPNKEYLTERLTDEAVNIIGKYAKQDAPFFMFMSYYTVHTPLQAPDKLVAKYDAKNTSTKRNNFADETQYFVSEPPPRKVRITQNHSTYAAMVESMDTGVGRILNALDNAGIADDTIVVFTSDNGGLSTAEGSPTSNLPLRGGKGWLYEGGIRVPYIVKVPNSAAAGISSDLPVSGIDFMKTLTGLTNITPPTTFENDGIDFSSLFVNGKTAAQQRTMVWHYPHYSNQGGFPGAAIRVGKMKLLQNFETGEVLLYDLSKDIGEQNNLASAMPDVTEALKKQLYTWYKETDARFLRPIDDTSPLPWEPKL